MAIGTPNTSLVVIRGNSGSGKSTLATQLRQTLGPDTALIQQDVLRRTILRERSGEHGHTAALIDITTRHCLDQKLNVVLEGTLATSNYEAMLELLYRDHSGTSLFYAYDLSFEETVRRHSTRPQVQQFTPGNMAQWFLGWNPLWFVEESKFTAEHSLDDALTQILGDLSNGRE